MGKGKPKGHETKADLAIHIAISTMFAWANLVEALAQLFDGTDMPREAIHVFLDELQDLNDQVMPDDTAMVFNQMVRSIGKLVASND